MQNVETDVLRFNCIVLVVDILLDTSREDVDSFGENSGAGSLRSMCLLAAWWSLRPPPLVPPSKSSSADEAEMSSDVDEVNVGDDALRSSTLRRIRRWG